MKKIIATGSMLAYILWFNSTAGAVAAAMPDVVTERTGRTYARVERSGETKLETLARKYEIDPVAFKKDMIAKKSLKEMLKKYDITKNQFRELVHAQDRA